MPARACAGCKGKPRGVAVGENPSQGLIAAYPPYPPYTPKRVKKYKEYKEIEGLRFREASGFRFCLPP